MTLNLFSRSPRLTTTLLVGFLSACSNHGETAYYTGGETTNSQNPGVSNTNTNVSFGGAQDFGYVRRLIEDGQVPTPGSMDAAGFFAEHHMKLPEPDCGERICLQSMFGVLGSFLTGNNCTFLQFGLNSPIVADPDKRPPLDLAVVVDVSGSMADLGKIEFVREGLGTLIDNMRDGDRLAIITYSTNVSVVSPLAEVALRRSELRRVANALVAEGSTNLSAGLREGFDELLRNFDSDRERRVILLSDGQPTVGETSTPRIFSMAKTYLSEGLGLTTVGLGTSFNVELMRGLAEQGNGNFYFLEDSSAVREVFEEELSYFAVAIAEDVQISVEAGTYYQLGRAYGSNLWEGDSSAGALNLPAVFVAHRQSSEDNELGRRGGGSALMLEMMPSDNVPREVSSASVADVDVSFRDPTTDEMVTDHISIQYPFHPNSIPERGHFEARDLDLVHKGFVMLNIYVGIEESSRAFHSGSQGEAATMLDGVIAGVEDYLTGVVDEDMEADLRLLRALRANMNWGATEPVSEDPWPLGD